MRIVAALLVVLLGPWATPSAAGAPEDPASWGPPGAVSIRVCPKSRQICVVNRTDEPLFLSERGVVHWVEALATDGRWYRASARARLSGKEKQAAIAPGGHRQWDFLGVGKRGVGTQFRLHVEGLGREVLVSPAETGHVPSVNLIRAAWDRDGLKERRLGACCRNRFRLRTRRRGDPRLTASRPRSPWLRPRLGRLVQARSRIRSRRHALASAWVTATRS